MMCALESGYLQRGLPYLVSSNPKTTKWFIHNNKQTDNHVNFLNFLNYLKKNACYVHFLFLHNVITYLKRFSKKLYNVIMWSRTCNCLFLLWGIVCVFFLFFCCFYSFLVLLYWSNMLLFLTDLPFQ